VEDEACGVVLARGALPVSGLNFNKCDPRGMELVYHFTGFDDLDGTSRMASLTTARVWRRCRRDASGPPLA
jgi:hypothetical protein